MSGALEHSCAYDNVRISISASWLEASSARDASGWIGDIAHAPVFSILYKQHDRSVRNFAMHAYACA